VVIVAVQSDFHLKIHHIIFFYFLKIIFDISISKRFENIKKYFLAKTFFQNLREHGLHRVPKQTLNRT
jgi:hypothetical protein